MTRIWTIGHSTRSLEEFLELLRFHRIQVLADVRQFPGSRRLPHFSQQPFSEALNRAGIEYVHFPELGGRRRPRPDSPNVAWRNEAFRGYADYMMSAPFRAGIDRLLKIADEKFTAIMCAEAVWWRCHRALIADYLKAAGHEVLHILGPGKTDEHPFTSAAKLVDGKLSYGESNALLFPS
jgi:uncharacterized protein (DUF488 family)